MRAPTEQTAGRPGGQIQAVLFDMDGLLVDSEPLWFEAEMAVMERLDGDWTHADQLALFGGSLRKSAAYLLARGRREATVDEVADWLVGTMAGLVAERELTLMPGALELLGQVRTAGVPTALVTSSERVIARAVLARLAGHGVEFGTTVCAEDVSQHKPHPEPYQRAASLLGADPARCVALEDSPNGVAAAEAAGCVTVAVPGLAAIPAVPGRLVARSLAELDLATLAGLVASR
jgi:HAD superfamily hydrolase (TIGR01509 family)